MHGKIGIIGHFGFNQNICNGQTIKTKNLSMLLETHGRIPAVKVDTYLFSTKKIGNILKLLTDSIRCVFTCEHIFLLVADRGMRFYLPFLYYLNKLARHHIYHYVVGSELIDLVEQNKGLIRYLNALDANWFEFQRGTQVLKEKGVTNVSTLANFKLITPVEKAIPYAGRPYRFCTFCRITEEKRIDEAIRAISNVNAEFGEGTASLDIYGPIEGPYAGCFSRLMNESPSCVRYMGVADSNESVDILKNYYALLFPSRWRGEGCPGTILDSFAAGIPAIASDWHANSEIIEHGRQGLIYPNPGMDNLTDAVRWAIQNPESMEKMRSWSRDEYIKYTPEIVLQTILRKMQSEKDA